MGRNARSNWSENQVSRRWAKVASIKGVLNQFFGPDYQAGAPGSEYLADARTAAMITDNAPDPPELAAFAPHQRLIVRFHDVIEPQLDQFAPTRDDVERLLAFGREVCKCSNHIVNILLALY